jgi:hypothetical protein
VHRSLIFLVLAFAAAAVWGQSASITLDVAGSPGIRFFTRPASDPDSLTPVDTEASPTIADIAPEDFVVAVNEETSLLAEKKAKDIKGTWKPARTEFTRHASLQVIVTHEGKPVEAAQVTVRLGTGERTALLTPADKGSLTFRNVPRAKATLVVQYKSGDDTKKTSPVEMAPPASGPWTMSAAIPDPVAVIEAAAAAKPEDAKTEGDKTEAKAPAQRNPLQNLLSLVLGLAVVGGIGYGIYRYFQTQPDQAKDLLEKAGLNPNAQPQGGPDPAVKLPENKPLQPIILSGADLAPAAGPVAAGFGALAEEPQLLLADSSTFSIPEGETKVGREAGAGLSLSATTGASREHAILRRQGSQVFVRDLGSTNGTYLNGTRLAGEAEVRPGDVVVFGQAQCRRVV